MLIWVLQSTNDKAFPISLHPTFIISTPILFLALLSFTAAELFILLIDSLLSGNFLIKLLILLQFFSHPSAIDFPLSSYLVHLSSLLIQFTLSSILRIFLVIQFTLLPNPIHPYSLLYPSPIPPNPVPSFPSLFSSPFLYPLFCSTSNVLT